MRSYRPYLLRSLLAAALVLGAPAAQAQAYPSKTIRMLVPNAPGGGLDIIARLVGAKLTESLRQTLLVDNRPGASGAIALETLAHAAADGYTLALISASQVISAALTKPSYDLFRDFAPVSQVSAAPYVLVVNPQVNAASVAELIEYAKANPGKLNYVTAGTGSLQHLATELFAATAGIKLSHVPYKGVGAAFPDLLANRVQMTMSSTTALISHIRSKALRPLAVTSAQRTRDLPAVPTMVEAGVRDFVVTQWHAVLAPSGTPKALIERLNAEIVKAVRQPDVVSRLEKDGTDPVGSSPQAFAALLKAEYSKWGAVIRQIGLKTE